MPPRGRVLAVDYGMKRTGLAISDAARIVATPLPAVVSEDLAATVAAIVAIAREQEVAAIVVGMPYLVSGLEGAQCARVRLFLSALKEELPPGVALHDQDERFTTREAEELLRPTGKRKRQLKSRLDSTAAVVILREFLEHL